MSLESSVYPTSHFFSMFHVRFIFFPPKNLGGPGAKPPEIFFFEFDFEIMEKEVGAGRWSPQKNFENIASQNVWKILKKNNT